MIYRLPPADDPIDQGDIIESCPIPWIAGFDIHHWDSLETVSSPERMVVLTKFGGSAHPQGRRH